jgi:hypothetical protein
MMRTVLEIRAEGRELRIYCGARFNICVNQLVNGKFQVTNFVTNRQYEKPDRESAVDLALRMAAGQMAWRAIDHWKQSLAEVK